MIISGFHVQHVSALEELNKLPCTHVTPVKALMHALPGMPAELCILIDSFLAGAHVPFLVAPSVEPSSLVLPDDQQQLLKALSGAVKRFTCNRALMSLGWMPRAVLIRYSSSQLSRQERRHVMLAMGPRWMSSSQVHALYEFATTNLFWHFLKEDPKDWFAYQTRHKWIDLQADECIVAMTFRADLSDHLHRLETNWGRSLDMSTSLHRDAFKEMEVRAPYMFALVELIDGLPGVWNNMSGIFAALQPFTQDPEGQWRTFDNEE
jgi:hypothetical protein